MLESLRHDNFAAHLHEPFSLVPVVWGQQYDSALHGPLRTLVLIEVEVLAQTEQSAPRAIPFSLIFREESRTILPQQIYSLQHATMGQLDLFLVPIGPDAQGIRYQAIFN